MFVQAITSFRGQTPTRTLFKGHSIRQANDKTEPTVEELSSFAMLHYPFKTLDKK